MTETFLPHDTSKVYCRFCKTLNDCSAEQETVGATLRMTKIRAGPFAEKNWMRKYYIGIHLYRNNTDIFFSQILLSQRFLKTISKFWKYFENCNIIFY